MTKRLGVTWHRLRPFWGELFERPLGFPPEETVYQNWSL